MLGLSSTSVNPTVLLAGGAFRGEVHVQVRHRAWDWLRLNDPAEVF